MNTFKKSLVIFMIFSGVSSASLVEDDIETGKRCSCNHKDLDKNLVNIYQDVEGNEDNYLRCSIFLFRCCGNASMTLSKILMVGSGVMTGLVTIPNFLNEPARVTIGTISTVLSLSSIALLSFKRYSKEAIEDREEQLKHVLKAHGIDVGD